jgi:hypothetical protein
MGLHSNHENRAIKNKFKSLENSINIQDTLTTFSNECFAQLTMLMDSFQMISDFSVKKQTLEKLSSSEMNATINFLVSLEQILEDQNVVIENGRSFLEGSQLKIEFFSKVKIANHVFESLETEEFRIYVERTSELNNGFHFDIKIKKNKTKEVL